MAILKVSPPPATEYINELRAWANDFYEQVNYVLGNIGEDNLETDFFEKLFSANGGGDNGI